MYQQLMVQFGDVERYKEEAKDAKVCPQILPQLQEILSDPQQQMLLKLELAATIDVGQHFAKATYFLEGDGPLTFSCYEKLGAVNQACQVPHYPNVHAIATAKGCFQSGKLHSMSSKIALSSITFKPV